MLAYTTLPLTYIYLDIISSTLLECQCRHFTSENSHQYGGPEQDLRNSPMSLGEGYQGYHVHQMHSADGKRNARWSLGLRLNAKGRGWRLSPAEKQEHEEGGRPCMGADMRRGACVLAGRIWWSCTDHLSEMLLCQQLYPKELYTTYHKAIFSLLRSSFRLNQKTHFWVKSFFLITAALLRGSVQTLSTALEMWAERRIRGESCWQQTEVARA